jgi:hypothetical protein
MYHLIFAAAAVVAGAILIFSPSTIFNEISDNRLIQTLVEYRQVVGAMLMLLAYYLYVLSDLQADMANNQVDTTISTEVDLPSYEQAISTSS